MPTTSRGLLYPAPTDPPNVPLDFQRLAEGVDVWLGRLVRKAAVEARNNTAVLASDNTLSITLDPGTYEITALLKVLGPTAAGFKCAWLTAGTAISSRECNGPTAGADPGAATQARYSYHGSTTAVPYLANPTTGGLVREEVLVMPVVPSTYTLQWAQNVATVGDTTLNTSSRLLITKYA